MSTEDERPEAGQGQGSQESANEASVELRAAEGLSSENLQDYHNEASIELRATEGLSQGQIVRKRFFRHRAAVVALCALILIVLLCVTSIGWGVIPGWWIHNYVDTYNLANAGGQPTMSLSFQHGLVIGPFPFGQDNLGHDMFAMTMRGVQKSLTVMVLIGLGATILGILAGALSGFFGGKVDMVIMRFTDMVIAIPAMIIGAVLGKMTNGVGAEMLGIALACVS